jgi:glycosyltransferase involved in cell wall biosynthesis
VLNNQNFLVDIARQIGTDIDLYYSYGIPVPYKVGKVNWFHLSNVFPLIEHSGHGLHLLRSIEFKWLGVLIRRNYKNAEVLSAESNYSLTLFPSNLHHNLVVSPNGSDKEIKLFEQSIDLKINDIAVIVGTFFHKDLDNSYNIFLELQEKNSKLRLVIIGDRTAIPHKIKNDQRVDVIGVVPHDEVITLLSSAKFYINMSRVENSWNTASEGALLAQESFISDIEPHIELLDIIVREKYVHNNSALHFEKKSLTPKELPTWSDIIEDMIEFTD